MKKCPKCGTVYENANTLCPSDGAVLVKTGDSLVGRTLAGKYRIDGRISEGGMGTVYRATHVLMEKTVAVKVLHPALAADEKIVARFTREAKAASRISHPHALTVTDFGEDEGGVVYLVMEYLRGKTLKEVVRAGGPMPLGRVVEIARQVAGALNAAHAEGVVHRDLKSDNIMLEEAADGGDWAKVLDFGIAKIQEPVGQDPELTAPNLIIGTPQYMSPEQCSQAHEIDARSDIYSFGVILYEMLVGHVPFTGDSATAIMLKHIQEPAPSVLDERRDVPPAVSQVIARSLSKRPEDRQQSAGELAEALALAATGGQAAAPATISAGESPAPAGQDTNRIVVPTAPLEARATANEDYDEATVVSRRAEAPETFARPGEPPAAASLNPWRVLIPAAFALLLIGGIFYAFQRNSDQPADANSNTAPLAVDPNAVPVQPANTPTGAGERSIVPASLPAGATPAQATTPAEGATAGGNPAAGTGETATPAASPSADADTGAQREDNSADDAEVGPTPAQENTGDQPRPRPTPYQVSSPTQNANTQDPPPPTPKPKPRQQEEPTPTPPVEQPSSADPPPPARVSVALKHS